jgi:hypothetical protein
LDETTWLTATDPSPMLAFLREAGQASDRKLRLFSVACCRRIWPLLADEASRRAVEVAERFADGSAGKAELQLAHQAATALLPDADTSVDHGLDVANAAVHAAELTLRDGVYDATAHAAAAAARAVAGFAAMDQASSDEFAPMRAYFMGEDAERAAQADILRDVFGPIPFREIRIDPAWVEWNDGTVRRISQGIYDEKAFGRMVILADALLDSGCDCEEMIEHCREQGKVHVRGCWCLDLLLGRA